MGFHPGSLARAGSTKQYVSTNGTRKKNIYIIRREVSCSHSQVHCRSEEEVFRPGGPLDRRYYINYDVVNKSKSITHHAGAPGAIFIEIILD